MKIEFEKFWNFVLITIIYIVIWQSLIWLVDYCSRRSNFSTEPFRFMFYIAIMISSIVIFVLVNRHKCGCYAVVDMRNPSLLKAE